MAATEKKIRTKRAKAPLTTRDNLSALIGSARKILRKDKGLNGDVDRLSRGCLDAVQELLRINGSRCDVRDERIDGTPVDVTFVGTLRPDLEEAVAAMLAHDIDVLCAPTAFGKTVTGAAIIARRRVNTLILVHRIELLRQWQERLSAFLGIGMGDVGTIGGGRQKPTSKINIAVIQSLTRKGEVDPLVEDYDQVIMDECHHVDAVSFDAILKSVKARFVLGITATPIRRDGQQPIIFMQCGPIRHTAAPPASAPHDLEVVPRTLSKPTSMPDNVGIQDIFRTSAEDQERTIAIADETQRTVSDGRKVLVLKERTDHLAIDDIPPLTKNPADTGFLIVASRPPLGTRCYPSATCRSREWRSGSLARRR